MSSKAIDQVTVFLCHASQDKEKVKNYYKLLERDGFQPWLDEENLLPGQNWQEVIPNVVRNSNIVIVFLSSMSKTKEGYVQKEIKFALDTAEEKPEDTIYLIPARLEDCDIPKRLASWHCVDLFKKNGYQKLVSSLLARANKLSAQVNTGADRRVVNFDEEDTRDEWLIYQVAFLWHGLNPPLQHAHWDLMTREIEDTKRMLHNAVDDGMLSVSRETRTTDGGITRYVTRDELKKFADSIGQKPAFLFKETRDLYENREVDSKIFKDNGSQTNCKLEEGRVHSTMKKIENLLFQIIMEQQNLFVRKSYGETATECFTWEDLDRFKQENTIAKVQRNLRESGKFSDLVDMLAKLPERRRNDIYQKGRYVFKKTWAELGEITISGQTDAGQKAEKMIADTIVELAREQVVLES